MTVKYGPGIYSQTNGNATRKYGPPKLSMPSFYAALRSNSLAGGSASSAFTDSFSRATIATYKGTDGLLKDAASDEKRFQDGSYLCENNSTNIITYSENFNPATSDWVLSGNVATPPTGTVYSGQTDPYGTSLASLLSDDNGGAFTVFAHTESGTVTNSVFRTFPIFIKKETGTPTSYPALNIKFTNGGSNIIAGVVIDAVNGTLITQAGTSHDGAFIEDWGDSWRVVLRKQNNASGNVDCEYKIFPAGNSDGSATLDSSATSNAAPNTFFGAQGEVLPTSYIPTSGAAVTRDDDIMLYSPCPWQVGSGSWSVKFTMPSGVDADMTASADFQLWAGKSSGGAEFSMSATSGYAISVAGTRIQVNLLNTDFTAGNTYKIAGSHEQLATTIVSNVWVNGVQKITNEVDTVVLDMNDQGFYVGYRDIAKGSFTGLESDVEMWTIALTNQELQSLTN